jgi:ribonuclease H2 subunit A
LFKIVGAASIIAKVTRDRYIENWRDAEDTYDRRRGGDSMVGVEGFENGGKGKRKREDENGAKPGVDQVADVGEAEQVVRGSGYPSDPRTQAYLKESLDPVFGYKGIVRFSWATVKVLLEKQAIECKW